MNPFTAWFDAVRFAADSQRVIALRLFKLAANDAKARTEASRMMAEKIAAMMDSHAAVVTALSAGHHPHVIAKRALTPYRKRVRANLARLSR